MNINSMFPFSYFNQPKEVAQAPQAPKEEDNEPIAPKVEEPKEEKAKRMIGLIVNELFSTEKSYHDGLCNVAPFLRKLNASLPNDSFIQAAGMIEKIEEVSNRVLSLLEKTKTGELPIEEQVTFIAQAVEQIDLELIDAWSTLYPVLCSELSQAKLQLAAKPIEDGTLLQTLSNHPLSASLISPIQRGPRYTLLLNELTKASTNAGLTNVADTAAKARAVVQAKMAEVEQKQIKRELDQLPEGNIRKLIDILQVLYRKDNPEQIVGGALGILGNLAKEIKATPLTEVQLNILSKELNKLWTTLISLRQSEKIQYLPDELQKAFDAAKEATKTQLDFFDIKNWTIVK